MEKNKAREAILQSVEAAAVPAQELPLLPGDLTTYPSELDKFKETTTFIGSRVVESREGEVAALLRDDLFPALLKLGQLYEDRKSDLRVVTTLSPFSDLAEKVSDTQTLDPHEFKNVDVAILEADFGVAENGALWFNEQQFFHRVLPYICQHLVVLLDKRRIVSNMHEAYKRIGASDFGFSGFIAGPSKTADIEQSLVLGAHGPRSHTIILFE